MDNGAGTVVVVVVVAVDVDDIDDDVVDNSVDIKGLIAFPVFPILD